MAHTAGPPRRNKPRRLVPSPRLPRIHKASNVRLFLWCERTFAVRIPTRQASLRAPLVTARQTETEKQRMNAIIPVALLAWSIHGGRDWGYAPVGGVGLLVVIVVVVLLVRR